MALYGVPFEPSGIMDSSIAHANGGAYFVMRDSTMTRHV